MKPPLDISRLATAAARIYLPFSTMPLPASVTLPPPTTPAELWHRWDQAQRWCYTNIAPGQWGRKTDKRTDAIIYEFADILHALQFVGRFGAY